jgi:hypothetical protein
MEARIIRRKIPGLTSLLNHFLGGDIPHLDMLSLIACQSVLNLESECTILVEWDHTFMYSLNMVLYD